MTAHHDLVPLLDDILGSHKQFAKGEHYYFCPFCHHHRPKLAVNVNTGMWHCWKCDRAGRSLLSLVRKLHVPPEIRKDIVSILRAHTPKKELTDDVQIEPLTLPTEFVPLVEGKGITVRRAISYLKNRGIRRADCIQYNIGYCVGGLYDNRIIIPSYDGLGRLNYFVGRDFTDSQYIKYRNPPVSKNVIGFESRINWEYPVVLAEGMFDAIAIRWNAIPLIGSTISQALKAKILETKVPVYLALDDDALKKTVKIARTLMDEGISVRFVELSGHDPADIGFAGMQRLIRMAQPMNLSLLVNLKLSLL